MQNKDDKNYSPYTSGDYNYVPKKYSDTNRFIHGAGSSFVIMLAFIGVQIVVILPFMFQGAYRTALGFKENGDVSMDEMTSVMMGQVDAIGLTVMATAVSTAVAVIWYRFKYCRNVGLKQIKNTVRAVFKGGRVLGIIFAAIGLYYAVEYLVALLGVLFPDLIAQYNKLIESLGVMDPGDWKVIIMTVLLAPVNEECIMRGLIFTKLKRNMIPILAIIVSAIYFGIFHLNIVQGIYATLLGLFMAYLANKYASIIPSLIFHAVFNSLNYILMLFPDSLNNSVIFGISVTAVSLGLWYVLEYRRKND